ncbi:hypothetical protein MHZ92_03685 [Sporosarcina sp. ACRSL]|uniref:hypothetical protein n=1 Tax=Sporosarcina sp. ACRSL TaxID=2918215 RepID=UPI001EF5F413|nr:hypothetical protein [Sporosarcina sp. ACRSL]MCG7343221.1 hypothetical protein [Sporosarcina sp. ACRSL]
MDDRFDLSFKNKEVRVWIYIMVPSITASVLLILFTEIANPYINLIPAIAWTLYYIWRFFFRRKQKKEVANTA